VGPHINKRSYANLKEYMVLINCENPEPLYLKYREDMNIIYHAQTIGFCDLWVITKEKVDIEGDVVAEGYRSDYYFPYAPNRSWEESLQIMWKKTNNFRSKDYAVKGIIKTHLNESVQWDSEDEALYQYFKYGIRKKLSPVMKKNLISGGKLYNWFQKLPGCCTIYTGYYPETLSAYDPYLFMIETDYKDFIVELFSELPTTSTFFTVSELLFMYIHVPKRYTSGISIQKTAKKLHIPLLLNELIKREIIKSKARAITEFYWGKEL
jgi:hypothetical protein